MKKIKNNFLIILLIVIVLFSAALFFLNEYQKRDAIKKLEFTFVDAKIEEVGLTSARVKFTVDIYNPTNRIVVIDRINAVVYANDIKAATLAKNDFSEFKPVTHNEIFFESRISYLSVGSTVLSLITEKNVKWSIVGQYIIDTYFDKAVIIPLNISLN